MRLSLVYLLCGGPAFNCNQSTNELYMQGHHQTIFTLEGIPSECSKTIVFSTYSISMKISKQLAKYMHMCLIIKQ